MSVLNVLNVIFLNILLTRGQSSSPGGVSNFHFSTSFGQVLGLTHLPIQWIPGAVSLGVKRPGHETDHTSN
jgi:hypothetical protein